MANKTKSAADARPGEVVRLKKRSYWGEIWHRLKKNPVAVVCLVFLVLLVGVLTGVGGGLMRDMMAGEEPYIFVKHIYACASLVGALGCVWIYRVWGRLTAVFIGAFIVMAIRFLAAHYRWNLPHPKSTS